MNYKIPVCLMLLVSGIILPGLRGQDADYWLQKGINAKNPDKKIEYLTKSIETEGAKYETYVNRGDVYRNLAIDASYNSHLMVIVFDKDKADFHNAKLMYYKARADYTKAIEIDPGCAEAYLKRSDAYRQLGQKENALADLSLLITIAPKNAEAYLKRASLYRNDFRDIEKSLADASSAIEIDPDNTSAYHVRGYNYYSIRHYENAMADYNMCIEIDPYDTYAYLRRGDIYRLTGQNEEAISDYCRTIEIDPRNYMAYNNRGLVYLIQSDYDKSMDDFKKAISLQPPDFPFSYNNAGYVCLQMDKIDLAIKYFNKCLSVDDELFAANLNLALVYYEYGDKEKARFYLERAKSSTPYLQEGVDGFAKLNKDWYYWTEQDKGTLTKMFLEFK